MGITSDFIKSNQVSKINELIPMAKLIFTKIHISILISHYIPYGIQDMHLKELKIIESPEMTC